MRHTIAFAAILALAVLPHARAATTVYTSEAAFLPRIAPDAFLNTFTGDADNPTTKTYLGNGYGYTVSVSTPDNPVYLNGALLGAVLQTDDLIITFTTGNVFAVGGNFFTVNNDDTFATGNVSLGLNDGTTVAYTSKSSSDFRGFVSTTPITSLTFNAPGADVYLAVDNLRVGNSVVPEAGTLPLFLLPAIGGLVARRKQNPVISR